MRSLFAGMIMLSASMAVVDLAQAQTQSQRPPVAMQAPIGHRQPTQYGLQPTQDDLQKIDKANRQLDLPASQDDITGAGPLGSKEDNLTNRIGQDNTALDGEITDICPTCGGVEAAPAHPRSGSIHHGRRPARAP